MDSFEELALKIKPRRSSLELPDVKQHSPHTTQYLLHQQLSNALNDIKPKKNTRHGSRKNSFEIERKDKDKERRTSFKLKKQIKNVRIDIPSVRPSSVQSPNHQISKVPNYKRAKSYKNNIDQALLSQKPNNYKSRRRVQKYKSIKNEMLFKDDNTLRKLIEAEVEKKIGHYMKCVIDSTQDLYIEHRSNIEALMNKVDASLMDVDDTKQAMFECNKAMNNMIKNVLDYKRFDECVATNQNKPKWDGLRQPKKQNKRRRRRQKAKSQTIESRVDSNNVKTDRRRRKSNHKRSLINLYGSYGSRAFEIRPTLTFVSIMTTDEYGFGAHIATAPDDMIIFKIATSIPTHAPRIKLWPSENNRTVHRYKVHCLDVEGTHYLWICTCKLHERVPKGKVTFVIQYESITNVSGISVNQTTDGSIVRVRYDMVSLPAVKKRIRHRKMIKNSLSQSRRLKRCKKKKSQSVSKRFSPYWETKSAHQRHNRSRSFQSDKRTKHHIRSASKLSKSSQFEHTVEEYATLLLDSL